MGTFELEVGHLAFDDSRVGPVAAQGQPFAGDVAEQRADKKGDRVASGKPRWKRETARRRRRRVPVKLRRSGSRPATVAASYMVRRTAR